MNRLGETESTPKKRPLKVEDIVLKDAITKSGRKVKRPAHLDSPERAGCASPSETRKSTAPRAKKDTEAAGTPGKRAAAKDPASPEEVRPSRKTITSARKAVKEPADTPKRNEPKEPKPSASTVDEGAGISKSGRKIKVPVKLMEFESEVLTSPRKTLVSEREVPTKVKAAKTPGRAKTPAKAAVSNKAGADEAKQRKTPGRRAKSVVPEEPEAEKNSVALAARTPRRKAATALFGNEAADALRPESPVPELQSLLKTPGKRAVKSLMSGSAVKTLRTDSPPTDETIPPKTPGRLGRPKSVAVDKEGKSGSETDPKDSIKAAPTPGRRAGRSTINVAAKLSREESPTLELVVPKTPGRRVGKSVVNVLHAESAIAEQAAPKTPGRRKMDAVVDTENDLSKRVTKTPGRRLDKKEKLLSEEQTSDTDSTGSASLKPDSAIQKDPSLASEDALSRSGRKIKPKRVFEFEMDKQTMEPPVSDGKALNDGRRKRKVDSTDEASIETILSPTKKKNTASASGKVETPKQCSGLDSVVESVQIENIPDGAVSRSGRKIKPKKMFGFEDGDSDSFVHITGSSSPTLIDEKMDEASSIDGTVQKHASEVAKTNATGTPSKSVPLSAKIAKKASTLPVEIDTQVKEQKQNDFITRRGVDDHHHSSDQTDCVQIDTEPVILRTSIGFGKPTTAKEMPLVESATLKGDAKATESVTPKRDKTVEDGSSSRSGRKIIPKKFFDADDVPSAGRKSKVAVPSVQGKLPVLTPEEGETEQATHSVEQEIAAEGSAFLQMEIAEDSAVKGEAGGDSVSVEGVSAEEINVYVGTEHAEEPNVLTKETLESDIDIATKLETEYETPPAPVDEEQQQIGEGKEQEDCFKDGDSVSRADIVEVGIDSKKGSKEGEINAQEEKPEHNVDSIAPVETKESPSSQQTDTAPVISDEQPNRPDGEASGETGDIILSSDKIDKVILEAERSESSIKQLVEGEGAALIETSLEQQNKETLTVEKTLESITNSATDNEMNTTNDCDTVPEKNVDESAPKAVVEEPGSERVSEDVPTENVISKVATSEDDEMLAKNSLGGIEYLEDQVNNIAECIKKSSPTHEASDASMLEESTDPSSNSSTVTMPAVNEMNETFSPVKLNQVSSSSGVPVIDITTDTPRPVVAVAAAATAATPRTPEYKSAVQASADKCSPDKPPEIIEIMDSPAVAAFCYEKNTELLRSENGGSATSTPKLVVSLEEEAHETQEELQRAGRKRSLSTSAVDTTMKRNVTFHSPANITVLVETIDERLVQKSLQGQQQQERAEGNESSHGTSIGEKLRKPRKRSLSEHKSSDLKRNNKISKLPNFKNIHANHFNRMESIADFMKRKETRAKHILASASPATKIPARPVAATIDSSTAEAPLSSKKEASSSTAKPFLFKSAGGGGIPVPSAGLFVSGIKGAPSTTTAVKAPGAADRHVPSTTTATSTTAKKPIRSDADKMANRLKQFQATFKPKHIAPDASAASTAASGATITSAVGGHPVEQLRSKQSKILKGVRTNRRFELQMKHRDQQQ